MGKVGGAGQQAVADQEGGLGFLPGWPPHHPDESLEVKRWLKPG